MPRLRWFDRKFDFSFPVELHPELLERLRGTPARLAERTAGIPASVQQRCPPHGWSIQEHVGHIADLDEELFLPRLRAYLNNEASLPAADLTNAATEAANHNGRRMDDVLETARGARNALVAQLEALDASVFARSAQHPRLGVPMRLVDMMFFMAEHDDHHLASITELARAKAAK